MGSTNRKLLIVVNNAAFFLSHREPVARAARDSGYEVVVATAAGPAVPAVIDAGYEHREIRLSRSGQNPLTEALSVLSLIRLFRSERPDIVHLVTIKPVLYGGIAARWVGVPGVISAVSGLGTVFHECSGIRASVARLAVGWLYRLALRHRNQRVIFQNPQDRDVLVRLSGLDPGRAVMILGSGVDLSEFRITAEPESDTPVVVMASRLLRDKGVCEFVDVARNLRRSEIAAHFLLVGDIDPGNPSSLSESQLSLWRDEATVEITGYRSDIARVFAESHIVVLPSYHEGLPKVLIEAAACGRPVVTTDIPGCRAAIEPGKSGLLVPPGDAAALADAIGRLLADPQLRRDMGRAGRALAEKQFSIEDVTERHLSLYEELLAPSSP